VYADDTNATSPTRDREDEWFTLNFEYEGDVFNHYPDFYDV
jgi:hypothetical protein